MKDANGYSYVRNERTNPFLQKNKSESPETTDTLGKLLQAVEQMDKNINNSLLLLTRATDLMNDRVNNSLLQLTCATDKNARELRLLGNEISALRDHNGRLSNLSQRMRATTIPKKKDSPHSIMRSSNCTGEHQSTM